MSGMLVAPAFLLLPELQQQQRLMLLQLVGPLSRAVLLRGDATPAFAVVSELFLAVHGERLGLEKGLQFASSPKCRLE